MLPSSSTMKRQWNERERERKKNERWSLKGFHRLVVYIHFLHWPMLDILWFWAYEEPVNRSLIIERIRQVNTHTIQINVRKNTARLEKKIYRPKWKRWKRNLTMESFNETLVIFVKKKGRWRIKLPQSNIRCLYVCVCMEHHHRQIYIQHT